jgi:hypothetical protein
MANPFDGHDDYDDYGAYEYNGGDEVSAPVAPRASAALPAPRNAGLAKPAAAAAAATSLKARCTDADAEALPPLCKCNEPAVTRTCGPHTKHPGEQFYTCAKRQHEGQCGFFMYVNPSLRSFGGGNGAQKRGHPSHPSVVRALGDFDSGRFATRKLGGGTTAPALRAPIRPQDSQTVDNTYAACLEIIGRLKKIQQDIKQLSYVPADDEGDN